MYTRSFAEHLEGHVLELDAEVLGDHRAGRERSHRQGPDRL
jgi:hypothetical protein